MSDLEIVDLTGELLEVFHDIADNRQQEVLDAATSSADEVVQVIRREGPDGSRWIEREYTDFRGKKINHGRPSIRLGHGPMDEGWLPPVIEKGKDGSAELVIGNKTPQAQFVTEGADPHSIPGKPRIGLSFWWFKRERAEWRPYIQRHPGIAREKPNFVERAMEQSGNKVILTQLEISVDNLLKPVRKIFSE